MPQLHDNLVLEQPVDLLTLFSFCAVVAKCVKTAVQAGLSNEYKYAQCHINAHWLPPGVGAYLKLSRLSTPAEMVVRGGGGRGLNMGSKYKKGWQRQSTSKLHTPHAWWHHRHHLCDVLLGFSCFSAAAMPSIYSGYWLSRTARLQCEIQINICTNHAHINSI